MVTEENSGWLWLLFSSFLSCLVTRLAKSSLNSRAVYFMSNLCFQTIAYLQNLSLGNCIIAFLLQHAEAAEIKNGGARDVPFQPVMTDVGNANPFHSGPLSVFIKLVELLSWQLTSTRAVLLWFRSKSRMLQYACFKFQEVRALMKVCQPSSTEKKWSA